MKRLGNLYKNIYQMENIIEAYDEVCRNTQNKRKVANLKEYRSSYISRIYNTLVSRSYQTGPYNIFTIYEPKERRIVSQGMFDKIVNHLVSRYILYPALLPCLLDVNVASRKYLGTRKGLELCNQFHNICKMISYFFINPNHI